MSEKKKRKFRFPILAKTGVIIFVMSIVIVEIAMTYYSIVISRRNKETYFNYADSLSATLAKTVEADDFNFLKNKVVSIFETIDPKDRAVTDTESEVNMDTYLAHYDVLQEDKEFMAAFIKVRTQLRDILSVHEKFNVDCAYLSYIYKYTDENGEKQGLSMYLVDSATGLDEVENPEDADACPPGCLDPLYPVNRGLLDDQTIGMPAYTTDTSYGYLISAASYIEGTERGYVAIDINMDTVRAQQANSIIRLFIYMVITINLIAGVGLLVVHLIFSKPLKKVTNTAKAFNNNDPQASHQSFLDLSVNTHDEVSDLADSIKAMEEGVVQRINELMEVNNALANSKMQTQKMTDLAKRDSLTGVGSKTAYDIEVETINEKIKNQEKPTFGIAMIDLNYLKNTNDEYGHVAGDDALIKLANIICLIFKYSPVYRVGGDEFIVILRNEDYKKANKLLKEFEERIGDSIANKKLPEYERVSAAIGLAFYDDSVDTCVEDTFKRADEKMYINKKAMKENK